MNPLFISVGAAAYGFLFLMNLPRLMGFIATLLLWKVAASYFSGRERGAIFGILILQASFPLLEGVARFPILLFSLATLLGTGIVHTTHHSHLLPRFREHSEFLFTLAAPLGLAAFVMAGFGFSDLGLPSAFIPWRGFLVAGAIGYLWFVLCLIGKELQPSLAKRISKAGWMAVLGAGVALVGNLGFLLVQASDETDPGAYLGWSERADRIGFEPVSDWVRKEGLEANAQTGSPETWVALAKGLPLDSVEDLPAPSEAAGLIASGGWTLDHREDLPEGDRLVGLVFQENPYRITVLSASGVLSCVEQSRTLSQLSPEVVRFVHCASDPNPLVPGGLLTLEAGGRVLRVDPANGHVFGELMPTLYGASAAVFTRLAVDPATGTPWALDLFGILYHRGPEGTWIADHRFEAVSRRGEITVDVARDLAISETGTIAVLASDGEIWKASLDSPDIQGPIRDTHYFPEYPVAISLAASRQGWEIADLHGGFFFSPYPQTRAMRAVRSSFLFPRSLPIREKFIENGEGVVDHVFIPERRWLMLLTGRGRLLVNRRWEEIWSL